MPKVTGRSAERKNIDMSNKPNNCKPKITRSNDFDLHEITNTVIGYLQKFEDATFVASVIARELFDFICAADGPEAAIQELGACLLNPRRDGI
jgi:hypothetical protein